MLVLAATVLGCGALLYQFVAMGPCPFVAHHAVARHDLAAIAQALEDYASAHGGTYPANLEALLANGEDDSGYLYGRSTLVPDPWRRPYLYEVSADGRKFRLQSLGRDGKPGGSDDDEDMSVTSKPAID
jgi:general secretion pathway protein G